MWTRSDHDKLMIMTMSIIDILSHDWCFSLHRVLPPPEGADKPKEEQASASGAAGGAAAKPSTSQPPKKKEVGEGTVKHPDGSKVHNRATYVIKINLLDAEHWDSPKSTNV